MKHLFIFILICGFISPSTFEVLAQDTKSTTTNNARYVRIMLQNGGMYEGEVLEIDESSFLINTLLLGDMRITKTDILNITYISADEVGQMRGLGSNRSGDINPQSTRYFFAPSAMQLKKGEGYYQNAWLLYNQASYGLSDHFTIGMSMTPVGTGGTVKLGFQLSDNVHVSAGGIAIVPFWDDEVVGIGFANMTFGNERKNVSIAFGNAFSYGENQQMLNVSGMIELNSRMWLITENYFLDDVSIISLGFRRASMRRDMLWDFSMIAVPQEEIAGIPWISCTIPF